MGPGADESARSLVVWCRVNRRWVGVSLDSGMLGRRGGGSRLVCRLLGVWVWMGMGMGRIRALRRWSRGVGGGVVGGLLTGWL